MSMAYSKKTFDMASVERQPITGSGGRAPSGVRGRAPGQVIRGAKQSVVGRL